MHRKSKGKSEANPTSTLGEEGIADMPSLELKLTKAESKGLQQNIRQYSA